MLHAPGLHLCINGIVHDEPAGGRGSGAFGGGQAKPLHAGAPRRCTGSGRSTACWHQAALISNVAHVSITGIRRTTHLVSSTCAVGAAGGHAAGGGAQVVERRWWSAGGRARKQTCAACSKRMACMSSNWLPPPTLAAPAPTHLRQRDEPLVGGADRLGDGAGLLQPLVARGPGIGLVNWCGSARHGRACSQAAELLLAGWGP